jgi:hypothetical protein
VASGIGITPALSVIRSQKHSRRINLIWAVRDKHLVEFFLRRLRLDNKGWNLIFYGTRTGKEPLDDEHMEIFSNTNICINKGRPKLPQLIPNIIYGIESGKGLPERYVPDEKIGASEMLVDMLENRGRGGNVDGGSHPHERSSDNIDDDDASISTQTFNEVIATARHFGFDLGGIDKSGLKSGLKTEPSVRCPKEHRRRRSTAIMNSLSLGFKPWEANANDQCRAVREEFE